MSVRRPTDSRADAAQTPPAVSSPDAVAKKPADVTKPRPPVGPRSLEEAEAAYVTARDAWTAAMRRCSSGRAADLASLAIAQEAYEQATAEVARWRSGERFAIKIEPKVKRAGLEAAIGQEMAWRRVHEVKPKQLGPLGRALRRLTRRD